MRMDWDGREPGQQKRARTFKASRFKAARLFLWESAGRMDIITTVREMQDFSETLRLQGKRIAFVPTMGYLHEGHLQLMKEGKTRGDCLVASIYVNPTQFGPNEDLEKYPRDFERDERLARNAGVDVIFYPSNAQMYPEPYRTYVTVEGITENLCGLTRPIHFRGVATVCAKLFNIVKPHTAVFGKKDFQQLAVIKKMVADLNMNIEIIGIPTVREPDGLAMSSRNAYLKEDERESALSLSRSLKLASELFERGEKSAEKIRGAVRDFIEGHPGARIDYVKICDVETMADVGFVEAHGSVLALAVWVGTPRLIDNYVFGETI